MPLKRRGYRKFYTRPPKYCRHYKTKPKAVRESESFSLQTDGATDHGQVAVRIALPSITRELKVYLVDCAATMKKRLSVLSLFDGIGTGLYALNELGFKVDVYYSCEIDSKAIALQKYRFHDQIKKLGCVTSLTAEKLDTLGKIDLLLAAPPCEDLSLVNPARKGLTGHLSTGRMFFQFKRILRHLERSAANRGENMYWMVENTFYMETKTRLAMSRHLQCEPVVVCASQFNAMRRRRLFWGNLPLTHEQSNFVCASPVRLQNLLRPYRKALVDTLPAITTSAHSERRGRNKRHTVEEEGIECPLFITEIEKAFGFFESFTDGPNLTLTDRRRLLGKAWSVDVIKHLLKPLLCSKYSAMA